MLWGGRWLLGWGGRWWEELPPPNASLLEVEGEDPPSPLMRVNLGLARQELLLEAGEALLLPAPAAATPLGGVAAEPEP